MNMTEEKIKAYALDQLREYLIINDIEISSKEEIKDSYLKMRNIGYFHKAQVNNALDVVRNVFADLAAAYDMDKDIVEKDLIFFGSRKVLEKMNSNKIKR